MLYAKSLRAIGQSLEAAGIENFELESDGQSYSLRTDSTTQSGEWILRNALSEGAPALRSSQSSGHLSFQFNSSDISRLDAQARKKRRPHFSTQTQISTKLSQLLRTVGDHLDRIEVHTFHISWSPQSVAVRYHGQDREDDSRTFTAEKLRQLGLHSRFRRSSRA
jgi:hypothetical protein